MCPDFRTFQYSSRAKILIHHGGRTDRKGQIDQKQALLILQHPLAWKLADGRCSLDRPSVQWKLKIVHIHKLQNILIG